MFNKIFQQIKELSVAINHRLVFFGFSSAVSCLLLTMNSLGFLTYYYLSITIESENTFFYVASFVMCNGSLTMSILLFNINIFFIYLRFELINSCIQKYFATREDDIKMFRGTQRKDLSNIVMKLADLHDNLVDVTVKMNSCFSTQTMNIIAGLFVINITSTFAMYRVFVQNNYENFNSAVIQYAWNIYILLGGFSVISLSSLMTRTGKFTAVLVHKAINFIDDDDDPIIDYVSSSKLRS